MSSFPNRQTFLNDHFNNIFYIFLSSFWPDNFIGLRGILKHENKTLKYSITFNFVIIFFYFVKLLISKYSNEHKDSSRLHNIRRNNPTSSTSKYQSKMVDSTACFRNSVSETLLDALITSYHFGMQWLGLNDLAISPTQDGFTKFMEYYYKISWKS